MADVPDPTYITADEVKEQTLISGLESLEEPGRKKLIQLAEDQIDAYVGPQEHHPDDETENRVFPRVEDVDDDGYAAIPYKVSRACLRQVEFLYTEWWDERTSALLPTNIEREQVSIGGDGSYSESRARGGTADGKCSLCDAARELLKGFVSRTCGIDVTDPDYVPTPS